ncbi:MAG: M48 family metallopeptidase [Tepidisphaerales bacterium]
MVVTLTTAGGCAVTTADELALGERYHQEFEKESGGRLNDPVVQSYVSEVGMSMVPLAGRPEMQWQFHVLRSNDVNAFAVPGGYIYITAGLLFRMQNEAQLAGVLGHEIGHIAARHSAQRIERSQTVGLLTAGVSILAEQAGMAAAGELGSAVGQLYLLRYSREHEREADMLGLKYMTRAGYNPRGIVQLMEILQAASGSERAGPLGEWTMTHPDPGNRIDYLNAAIAEKYREAENTGRWGVPEFRNNVLDRRRVELPPLDLSNPVLWCGHCREAARGEQARGQAAGERPTELLREVAGTLGG